MAKIKKTDASPLAAALLTFFIFNLGHLIINGQQRKWLYTFLAIIIGSVLCCIPGWIIGILSVVDSYQTAVRLQSGEEIDDNEYSNVWLYKAVKIIDKTATCSAAK
ncbi:MAG: hypothetical protein NTX50_17750 [Candidatus Sumerlaeota bacterium]|nr:hypothetical protein [Candidatus Sumerlaeota bacterium]